MTFTAEEVTAVRTWTKTLPMNHPLGDGRHKHTLTATAKLYRLGGNARPYFSLTAEVRTSQRRNDPIVACGQLHEDVVAAWPKLKLLADIHLSDDDGVPMHAVANAAYWLGFTEFQTAKYAGPNGADVTMPYFPHFMSTWRVSDHEARVIYDWCRMEENKEKYNGSHGCLEVLAALMLPRWKKDAETALSIIRDQK